MKLNFKTNFYISIAILRSLLDFCYIYIVNEKFSYRGFDNQSTLISFFLSWLILISILPFAKKIFKIDSISSNILLILFVLYFVPMTTLVRFLKFDYIFLLQFYFFWFILLNFYFIIPNIIIKRNFNSNFFFVYLITFFYGLTILFISAYYFKFRLYFNFIDVYQLRNDERDAGIPVFFRYILSSASNILPFLTIFFIYQKKTILSIFLIIIIFFNFSIGGHKDVIIKLLLCLVGYYSYNKYSNLIYINSMSLLTIISLIEYFIFGSFILASIAIRRALFIPALLNYQYYKFFTKHPSDYFQQSFLSWFGFKSIYKYPIPKTIGFLYDNDFNTSANNGLYSDAFSNLNVLGLFIFPIILLIIFKLFDSVSIGLNKRLFILPILSCLTFGSTNFTTVLLTNGILLLMLIFYLLPRENNFS